MTFERKIAFRCCCLLSVILFISSCGSSEGTVATVENPNTESISDSNTDTNSNDDMSIPGNVRDITSFQLVAEMGVGWNLGNSFDVIARDKTTWGNPLPNKAIIDAVREIGFTTLRIPITWNFHQQSTTPYTIEEDYLDRVQSIVNYGLQNKMHVIVNVHHDDDDWLRPTFTDEPEVSRRLERTWTQIAERFKVYGDSLIFEAMNEPRLKGSPEEWTGGTSEGRQVVNNLHKVALDAIRATGGNNANRHIMISTYAAGTSSAALNDLVIPNNDPNVIISQHSYFPWPFAGEGAVEWGSDQDRAELDAELDKIYNKWIVQENRPVILGEWGTVGSNNINQRLDYADYYARGAMERGMLPVVWDDGGNFILFERHNLTWRHRDIAEAIIQASSSRK